MEGVTAERIYTAKKQAVEEVLQRGRIPLLVDPDGRSIEVLKPDVVVDAIIAKKNLGTYKEMAPLVIGIGPGFVAGKDVHLVVESMRGHNLARILRLDLRFANTGIPGNIGGYTKERGHSCSGRRIYEEPSSDRGCGAKGEEIARIYEQMSRRVYFPEDLYR